MYSTWTLYVHPHIHTYMVWRCMIVCVHCVCLCMLANWAHVVGIETEPCGQQQTFHMLLSDYRLDSVCECHSIYWSARLKLESAFHHPQRLHFPHCLVGWLTIDTNLCSRLIQIFAHDWHKSFLNESEFITFCFCCYCMVVIVNNFAWSHDDGKCGLHQECHFDQ